MLRGCFGNLIFAIIARMLCRNHLNLTVTYHLVYQHSNSNLKDERKENQLASTVKK